jgi:hypothetical protein
MSTLKWFSNHHAFDWQSRMEFSGADDARPLRQQRIVPAWGRSVLQNRMSLDLRCDADGAVTAGALAAGQFGCACGT